MKLSSIFLACVFLLFIQSVASACSCVGYASTCEAYAHADAVFIGTVSSIEEPPPPSKKDKEEMLSGGQIAHVQIEKVFKGIKATEVLFRSYDTSCDTVYAEGQRWLFYGYYDKRTKMWHIAACDRSTHIEDAAEDLLYLQGLPATAQKTRLAGSVKHFEDDPFKNFTFVGMLAGTKVKITGAQKSYEVYTDKNGVYEIYGLPPGEYLVESEIPLGLKLRFPIYFGETSSTKKQEVAVVLKEKSCAGVNFIFSADTQISGKVFGADGRAMPDVRLSLMPKDKVVSDVWNFDRTDAQGRYELDEIPPGEYIIVVNSDDKISSDEPFHTLYYPGVFEKEKATVLNITAGTRLEDYDIHIPAQEATRVIEGVLLYSDGRPVANEFVYFHADEAPQGYDGENHIQTDEQGRFSLTVLQSLKGWVNGEMSTYQGKYVNCSQLEKLIKASGDTFAEIKTKPVRVEAGTDMQNVKLVFPFPYCVKAKVD